MKLIIFIFPFLFVRNWHTGELELSRPRVVLFGAMLALIIFGLVIAGILQSPVIYTSAT